MNLLSSVKNLSTYIIAEKGSTDNISQDNHLQWTNSIDQVDRLLDRLIEASGKDFLRIAENLQEYYTRAQKMCDKSSKVVKIMTGEALRTATDGLQEILEELKDHINESQGHFSQISKAVIEHRVLQTACAQPLHAGFSYTGGKCTHLHREYRVCNADR
jgi:hypothetical protein